MLPAARAANDAVRLGQCGHTMGTALATGPEKGSAGNAEVDEFQRCIFTPETLLLGLMHEEDHGRFLQLYTSLWSKISGSTELSEQSAETPLSEPIRMRLAGSDEHIRCDVRGRLVVHAHSRRTWMGISISPQRPGPRLVASALFSHSLGSPHTLDSLGLPRIRGMPTDTAGGPPVVAKTPSTPSGLAQLANLEAKPIIPNLAPSEAGRMGLLQSQLLETGAIPHLPGVPPIGLGLDARMSRAMMGMAPNIPYGRLRTPEQHVSLGLKGLSQAMPLGSSMGGVATSMGGVASSMGGVSTSMGGVSSSMGSSIGGVKHTVGCFSGGGAPIAVPLGHQAGWMGVTSEGTAGLSDLRTQFADDQWTPPNQWPVGSAQVQGAPLTDLLDMVEMASGAAEHADAMLPYIGMGVGGPDDLSMFLTEISPRLASDSSVLGGAGTPVANTAAALRRQ